MPAIVGSPSTANNDATDTTISVVRAGVTAGHGILLYVKYEDNAADVISSVSDGTTNFTANKFFHGSTLGAFAMAWFYLPASVASGSVTYTVTLSASRSFKRLIVVEMSYSGTLTFVTPNFNDQGGISSYQAPTGIANTDADALFFGSWSDFSGVSTSAELMGGVSRDGVAVATFDSVWWKLYASTGTRAPGATLGGSATAITSVIAAQEAVASEPPSTAELEKIWLE